MRDAAHDSLCGALAFDKNDHVIGIARKAMAPPRQLLVELVQQDTGQQPGQRSALRRTKPTQALNRRALLN